MQFSRLAAPDAGSQHHLPPLVLDVDGALVRTDLLHETAIVFLKGNPLRVFFLIFWLMQGKAVLKRKLGERVTLAVDDLPAHDDLVRFAAKCQSQGRKVGLATAADELLARRIARRFDFVSFVIASDGITNVKGSEKAVRLAAQFPDGFAYAGDSKSDLRVWEAASSIVLVGTTKRVAVQARKLGKPVEAEFARAPLGLRKWAKALRLHQWAKNALVFVPLILSGMASDLSAVASGLAAFFAMSFMASGTYLINDLFDLADDRKHWTKRYRPLASGAMRIDHAVLAASLLIGSGLVITALLNLPSLLMLLCYMTTTLAYSFYLKRLPIIDAFTLAALFTLRLGIGITAVSAVPSPWLLVFSMFLFTSLSFAKRQTEIQRGAAKNQNAISGRGYQSADAGLVLAMGIATGMTAIMIMVLYIMNDVYREDFYSHPIALWVLPNVLFIWISRIWLLCHRGQLNDDPVAFAVRDKASIALGGLMAAAFLVGWLA